MDVLRKEGNDWVKKSMDMTVEGSRGELCHHCRYTVIIN